MTGLLHEALHCSKSLRRIVFIFTAGAVAALTAGVVIAVMSGNWGHFGRSGAVVSILGVVLTSRKFLMTRNDLVHLLHEMEKANGTTRTAQLQSFKQLQKDLDRQIFERAGFGLIVLGTIVWAFGDLIGLLSDG